MNKNIQRVLTVGLFLVLPFLCGLNIVFVGISNLITGVSGNDSDVLWGGAFLLIFGIFLSGITGIMLFVILRKFYLKRQLEQRGERVTLQVKEITQEYIAKRDRTNYYLICEYRNPLTGEIRDLKSQKLRVDPSQKYKIGSTVSVLMDPENKDLYMFEIEN